MQEHLNTDVLTVCRGYNVGGKWIEGCGTMVVWAKLVGGGRMPIESEAIKLPRAGLVAYNPDTGGGKVLTKDDVESGRAATWAGKHRMTFHLSHMAQMRCPVVRARKERKK